MPDDLNAMAVFAAVADARGFRAAGDRLGISASAGERLYASVRPALEEVRAAVHTEARRAPRKARRTTMDFGGVG